MTKVCSGYAVPAFPPMKNIHATAADEGGQIGTVRELYRYVLRTSGRTQLVLSVLAIGVFLLELAPLELQRRIVNRAVDGEGFQFIALLCLIYIALALVQGSLKLVLNVYVGSVGEAASLRLRTDEKLLAVARAAEANGAEEQGVAISVIVSATTHPCPAPTSTRCATRSPPCSRSSRPIVRPPPTRSRRRCRSPCSRRASRVPPRSERRVPRPPRRTDRPPRPRETIDVTRIPPPASAAPRDCPPERLPRAPRTSRAMPTARRPTISSCSRAKASSRGSRARARCTGSRSRIDNVVAPGEDPLNLFDSESESESASDAASRPAVTPAATASAPAAMEAPAGVNAEAKADVRAGVSADARVRADAEADADADADADVEVAELPTTRPDSILGLATTIVAPRDPDAAPAKNVASDAADIKRVATPSTRDTRNARDEDVEGHETTALPFVPIAIKGDDRLSQSHSQSPHAPGLRADRRQLAARCVRSRRSPRSD